MIIELLFSIKIKDIQINKGRVHKTVGTPFPTTSETSVTIYKPGSRPGQQGRKQDDLSSTEYQLSLLSTNYVPTTVLSHFHVLLYPQQPVRQ